MKSKYVIKSSEIKKHSVEQGIFQDVYGQKGIEFTPGFDIIFLPQKFSYYTKLFSLIHYLIFKGYCIIIPEKENSLSVSANAEMHFIVE